MKFPRHLLALAIFFLLTLAFTNPLILHIWNAVEDKQDALLNTWIIAWVGHALTTNPLDLFNGNIFYPYSNTLAFSEINLPQGMLALPLMLATNNPILGYNIVLLAGFFLDASAMYLLALDLTRARGAAIIAGAIYAFNPYNLGNLAQEQLIWLGLLPLALFFLRRLVQSPNLRNGFLFALFFSFQTLASIYYGFFSALAVGLYLIWHFVSGSTTKAQMRKVSHFKDFISWCLGGYKTVLWLVASALLIAVFLAPFLIPYFQVQRDLGFQRSITESEPFSASLKLYTEVAPQNFVYGRLLAPNPPIYKGGYPLDNLFPGFVALALAVIGFVSRKSPREKWFALGVFIVAFILSFGPRLYLAPNRPTNFALPYAWLYDHLDVMHALRAPVRFDALVMFALALLAAFGVSRFQFGARPLARLLAPGLCLSILVVEYFSLPAANIVSLPVAGDIPPEYQWLAQQPRGVILEYPMLGPDASGQLDLSRQYFSAYHWQATPDGYSGFIPPRRGEIAYEMEELPGERTGALLSALDVRYLTVHIDQVPTDRRDALNHTLAFNHDVTFLKQFGATWIYQVNPVQPARDVWVTAYVPRPIQNGVPFYVYLILMNRAARSLAVKPTDVLNLSAHWNDGRVETVSVPLPLVTSSASVVPILLHAPAKLGEAQIEFQNGNDLIGNFVVTSETSVENAGAGEVVIPARVVLNEPLARDHASGETMAVDLTWQAENKIDAYYSVSVRVVDDKGNKIVAVDRQPNPPTLLWRPLGEYRDLFQLPLPHDMAPGNYRVELLIYQANDGTSVLLLDDQNVPLHVVELGQIEIK